MTTPRAIAATESAPSAAERDTVAGDGGAVELVGGRLLIGVVGRWLGLLGVGHGREATGRGCSTW